MTRIELLSCGLLVLLTYFSVSVQAQPSPKVQKRIKAAIQAAVNATGPVDYTQFVNVFIGTDNFGDVW